MIIPQYLTLLTKSSLVSLHTNYHLQGFRMGLVSSRPTDDYLNKWVRLFLTLNIGPEHILTMSTPNYSVFKVKYS